MTRKPSLRIALLVASIVLVISAWQSPAVRADDPTPIPVVSTPVVTLEPPTIEAEPTLAATPIRELGKPSPTVPPPATLVPTIGAVEVQASPTPRPIFRVRPTSVVVPTPVAVDTPKPVSASVPDTEPWPSADELRLNARLRWGTHVPSTVKRWAFLIVPAARKYHLDPNLIAAVMTMESNGDPLALSPADARGLMQVLHGPWDPRQNVFLGAKMLADLYGQFGDWSLTLAGYNAGPEAVSAYGGIPPYRETRDYVIIVQYLWDLYGHRHLTESRKKQYRKTLSDLTHFKDQSKKVPKLARIAQVPDDSLNLCAKDACQPVAQKPAPAALDPFWPDGTAPDPLQTVDQRTGYLVVTSGSRNVKTVEPSTTSTSARKEPTANAISTLHPVGSATASATAHAGASR